MPHWDQHGGPPQAEEFAKSKQFISLTGHGKTYGNLPLNSVDMEYNDLTVIGGEPDISQILSRISENYKVPIGIKLDGE